MLVKNANSKFVGCLAGKKREPKSLSLKSGHEQRWARSTLGLNRWASGGTGTSPVPKFVSASLPVLQWRLCGYSGEGGHGSLTDLRGATPTFQ